MPPVDLQKTYDNAKAEIISEIGVELYNNAFDYVDSWLDATNEVNPNGLNNMNLKNIVNIVNLKRNGQIK